LPDVGSDAISGSLDAATPNIATQSTPTGIPQNSSDLISYGEDLNIPSIGDNVGSNVGLKVNAGTKSPFDEFVSKMGDTWDKLGPTAKAEVAKSLMAIPGGIQKQKNDERMLAIQKQNADANTNRVNQTSYGNQVVGIINKAKVG